MHWPRLSARSALSCRCVPLILSTQLEEHLPFREIAADGEMPPYHNWSIFVPEARFIANPNRTIGIALREARPRLSALRTAMDAVAPHLLYDAPGSRVGDNLLREWSGHCRA